MRDDKREVYERLGRQVSDARKASGLRQDDIAKLLGVSRSSVANFEAGRQTISAYDLLVLHEALGLEFPGLQPVPGRGVDLAGRRRLVEENEALHRQIGRIRLVLSDMDGEGQ